MGDPRQTLDIGNLVVVDRAVAAARVAHDIWSRKKHAHPEDAANGDPWRLHRKIAGKSVYDALGSRPPLPHETDFVAALRAHVRALVVDRVTFETDVSLAEKTAEPLGIVDLGKPRKISWREAWRGVIATARRPEAAAYLDALGGCGDDVGSAVREHRARRHEAEYRLGDDAIHASISKEITFAKSAARALLDTTEDVARDAIRAALRRNETTYDRASPVDVIAIAAARDAISGWPSRLTARWLEELFAGHVRGLAVDPLLPQIVIGASSFVRALEAFGHSLGRAIALSSSPFVLADDPQRSGAQRVAALFGGLGTSSIFYRRALGLGTEEGAKNARILARSALLETRVRAARILLGETESPSAPLFEEVTFRVFGASLPPRLREAWPLPRADEAARFIAALEFPSISRSFVDRFDDDWFKNPRAYEALRRALPQASPGEPNEAAAVGAARQFAHALERALA